MDSIYHAINVINPAIGAGLTATAESTDKFGAPNSPVILPTPPPKESSIVSKIFGTLMTIFALYLVFTCKDIPGTNMVLNLIAAFCCAPFYIIYRIFFKPCKKLF